MRGLTRLPEPQILVNRGNQWLTDFINSGKSRPDSSKYAHNEIKTQLKTMSFHKCFYCESKLKDTPKEVDHHIEVSVDNTLSFIWTNLYLSCDNCNGKVNHSAIPIHDALDPCRNTDLEIEEHLTFVDEMISVVNNSAIGLKTIQKYRLDSDLLDKRRITQLKYFLKALDTIRLNQISEGGRALNQAELRLLNYFKQDDQPYSLMFKIILAAIPKPK